MAENRMELFIETLTGTAFELSCSPLETIVSIKAKIQYSEGIPVSQQHLIWKSQELNDDLCLQDYSINDGATLKLVLGMRGGPINTRPDTTNLKVLADVASRETAGSEGRPLTVLVFHDGDRVHMYYTLIKRGECAASPMSEAISETSSVASIKQREEFDQDVAKEHEATRGKVIQLQEQLRALSINRPKRITKNSVYAPKVKISSQSEPTSEKREDDFHLPPIGRSGALNNPSTSYSHKNAQPITQTGHRPGTSSIGPASHSSLFSINESNNKPLNIDSFTQHSVESRSKKQPALDFVSNNISTCILGSPNQDTTGRDTESCSNFYLPYITHRHTAANQNSSSFKGFFPALPSQKSPIIAVNLSTPSLGSIIKRDPSQPKKVSKHLPLTSSQALAPRKVLDLDVWLQTRPKTSPAKTKSSFGERICKAASLEEDNDGSFFKNPESGCERKSRFVDELLSSSQPSSLSQCNSVNTNSSDKVALGSLVSSSIKAVDPLNEPEKIEDFEVSSIIKSSKYMDESNIAFSNNKLPLINPKKKSHKRCSQCSRKTGLATSYTCRCGKNFCASHRYAEVHHCSYDYKTEGRRLLQLNNPVVTASKLPKI